MPSTWVIVSDDRNYVQNQRYVPQHVAGHQADWSCEPSPRTRSQPAAALLQRCVPTQGVPLHQLRTLLFIHGIELINRRVRLELNPYLVAVNGSRLNGPFGVYKQFLGSANTKVWKSLNHKRLYASWWKFINYFVDARCHCFLIILSSTDNVLDTRRYVCEILSTTK